MLSALYFRPGNHFTNGLKAQNWNFVKIHFVMILILMIQPVHTIALVTAAQLLRHVQNYDLIWLSFINENNCSVALP